MKALSCHPDQLVGRTSVLFVDRVNKLTIRALTIGRSLGAGRLEAVKVTSDAAERDEIASTWSAVTVDVPLRVIANTHEDWVRSAADYIRVLAPCREHPITVIVPQLLVPHWYHRFLHNQSCKRLESQLLRLPWVTVLDVPFELEGKTAKEKRCG